MWLLYYYYAGPLDSVSNLCTSVDHRTTEEVLITWTPPYSLDLSDIEPDIVYCVGIYNITCESRDLLFSNCSVTNSELVVNLLNASQYIFEIIVTPRSNTESARNGTSNAVKGSITSWYVPTTRLNVISSPIIMCRQIYWLNEGFYSANSWIWQTPC